LLRKLIESFINHNKKLIIVSRDIKIRAEEILDKSYHKSYNHSILILKEAQMEKVTINIEGTADEVIASLQRIVGTVQQPRMDVTWLPNEIEDFFEQLQPEAQRVLEEIATDPEGYDRGALIAKLRVTGRGLAGRLSSVGHNIRRSYPMKPRPIELDEETEEYTMLPEFVEWIRRNRGIH